MRRVLILLGVLGSGTALSFGAAAAVLLANPNSRMVPVSNPTGFSTIGGGKVIAPPVPVPMPVPMPAIDLPANDGTGAMPPDAGVQLGVQGGTDVVVAEADLPPQSGTEP